MIALMAVMWTLATHPERIGGSSRGAIGSSRIAWHTRWPAGAHLQRGLRGRARAARPGDRVRLVVSALGEHRDSGVAGDAGVRDSDSAVRELSDSGDARDWGRGADAGWVGSFHEAYRIAVTTFFHAPNNAAVSAALVLHAVSFFTSLVPGVVIMAHDGLSVAGLGRLAGVARQGNGQEPIIDRRCSQMRQGHKRTDEVPVLRPSGR